MIIPRPAVFIFGAGATRGGLDDASFPPPPIDSDFFDIANQVKGHGTPQLAKKVLHSAWELYGQTTGISLEKYYRDIETRAAIGNFAKPANQPKNWIKRQKEFVELLRRVYIQTTCSCAEGAPITSKQSKKHSIILRQLKAGDTLVTFNYDLVIEESFEKSNLWNPSDGYGISVQGVSFDWCRQWAKEHDANISQESVIHLLKLHGSLNWTLYNNREIRLKPRPYLVRTKNKLPAYEKVDVLAPGWNKKIDRNPYKLFWREAKARLERCNALIILGYSLPETDLLAHALFAEVVRQRIATKNILKELHLVDPLESVKDRFKKLFIPALADRGKVFLYKDLGEFVKIVEQKGRVGDSLEGD